MVVKNGPSKVCKAGGERLQRLAVGVNSIDLSALLAKHQQFLPICAAV